MGLVREGSRTFKAKKVSEEWLEDLNKKVRIALRQAIANVHWLVPLGIKSNHFLFMIEFDWSSWHTGYMPFASKNDKEQFLDLGSKVQNFASSSYLRQLHALA